MLTPRAAGNYASCSATENTDDIECQVKKTLPRTGGWEKWALPIAATLLLGREQLGSSTWWARCCARGIGSTLRQGPACHPGMPSRGSQHQHSAFLPKGELCQNVSERVLPPGVAQNDIAPKPDWHHPLPHLRAQEPGLPGGASEP